jgi:hypothetical protein
MNFSSDEGLHSNAFSRSHISWMVISAAHNASRLAVPLGALPWRETLDICAVGGLAILYAAMMLMKGNCDYLCTIWYGWYVLRV